MEFGSIRTKNYNSYGSRRLESCTTLDELMDFVEKESREARKIEAEHRAIWGFVPDEVLARLSYESIIDVSRSTGIHPEILRSELRRRKGAVHVG